MGLQQAIQPLPSHCHEASTNSHIVIQVLKRHATCAHGLDRSCVADVVFVCCVVFWGSLSAQLIANNMR